MRNIDSQKLDILNTKQNQGIVLNYFLQKYSPDKAGELAKKFFTGKLRDVKETDIDEIIPLLKVNLELKEMQEISNFKVVNGKIQLN